MSAFSELITKIKATIYANATNQIDAQKHQDLEVEIVTRLLLEIGASSGGYIGNLSHSDIAPAPGKDGFYIMTDSGSIPYVTGQTSCNMGDYLTVLNLNGDYNYTLIPVSQYLRELSFGQYPFVGIIAYPTLYLNPLTGRLTMQIPTDDYQNRFAVENGRLKLKQS